MSLKKKLSHLQNSIKYIYLAVYTIVCVRVSYNFQESLLSYPRARACACVFVCAHLYVDIYICIPDREECGTVAFRVTACRQLSVSSSPLAYMEAELYIRSSDVVQCPFFTHTHTARLVINPQVSSLKKDRWLQVCAYIHKRARARTQIFTHPHARAYTYIIYQQLISLTAAIYIYMTKYIGVQRSISFDHNQTKSLLGISMKQYSYCNKILTADYRRRLKPSK